MPEMLGAVMELVDQTNRLMLRRESFALEAAEQPGQQAFFHAPTSVVTPQHIQFCQGPQERRKRGNVIKKKNKNKTNKKGSGNTQTAAKSLHTGAPSPSPCLITALKLQRLIWLDAVQPMLN